MDRDIHGERVDEDEAETMSDQPLDTIAPDVPPRVEQLSKRRARGDVRPPADAFHCFMGTDVDCLAIGNGFLRKEEQPPSLSRSTRIRWNLIDEDGTFGRE